MSGGVLRVGSDVHEVYALGFGAGLERVQTGDVYVANAVLLDYAVGECFRLGYGLRRGTGRSRRSAPNSSWYPARTQPAVPFSKPTTFSTPIL